MNVIGVLAEVLGSVAIIVSLFYLASQIRQNTRATRSATYQSIVSHAGTSSREVIRSPELAQLLIRAGSASGNLTEDEELRFSLFASSWLRHYDGVYYHYKSGLLERGQWEGFEYYLKSLLTIPTMAAWWAENSTAFSPEFRSLVASLMNSSDGGSDANAV